MARSDSLRLLLAAETPRDVEGIDALIAAINEFVDYRGGPAAAKHRIDELLDVRIAIAVRRAE